MGIKEDIWWNEHWVVYAAEESLTSTPETKKKKMFNKCFIFMMKSLKKHNW